ncbi:MAG: hypothetical protein L6R38_002293 [Xanthoria sp. 2 TBL-2021]|nr:MAG: hypothetical protein L6R38_002293 [Xanthoria sp. 2 TBL-2021]
MSNYITTHNAEGKAIFSDSIPTARHVIDNGMIILEYIYTGHSFPANLSSEADITQFDHDRIHGPAPGSTLPPKGFATAIVTIKPDAPLKWHRVMCLDTFYVIEGDFELSLDSGETRTLHAGDSFVQRATMHTGKNVTPNGGALKLLGSAVPCVIPVEVGEHKLEEEWKTE